MRVAQRILIVRDDRASSEPMSQFLIDAGYVVTISANAREMERELKSRQFDLLLLNAALPGEGGDSACRRLRQGAGPNSDIPIIMVSADGEEVDRVIGLELGADDYLTQPFSLRELLARIRAVVRRYEVGSQPRPLGEFVSFMNWRLFPSLRQLTTKTGEQVVLTSAEFDLLKVFCMHPGQVLTRDMILDLTQGRIAGPLERSVDILVSRLRHKLEEQPEEPQLIKTVHGKGYVFTALE
jgi:two-component system, OmpR family, response regulator